MSEGWWPAAKSTDEKWVSEYRGQNPAADSWAGGYGVIQHSAETQARIFGLAERLKADGIRGDGVPLFDLLQAADRVASAGMWLVVHETYANRVNLDGRPLQMDDFKTHPEGHTGGSLNMVPGYVGYMAINAITGRTRSWIMGQGHCVSAIDSVNLLLDNMTTAHAERYSLSDEGLTRYVRDFYSYKIGADGTQDSPLGSHVNANTAGSLAEGGYLGFTELQYVHMPLPDESLVVFLSDGAFEEQRGSDWASRWWRAEDCGLVAPIMIDNGRRIDQRTMIAQEGGADWLAEHLRLNSFDPIVFDGRDPAAFAWAIFEMERRLSETKKKKEEEEIRQEDCRLPHGIAVAPKGAGFYGEGTNLAHNLPLGSNPHTDAVAAGHFNTGAHRLWVPPDRLREAIRKFQGHRSRPRERDHPLVRREVSLRELPPLLSRPVPEDRSDRSQWIKASAIAAVDSMFLAIVRANPELRPRVGNPDEMSSNRLQETLDNLKFRVLSPESGIPESVHGSIISVLNEEAVASAALANKGGINMIATYEAFGMKMEGVVRQEITFTKHCNESGRPQNWLSIPLVLTSHTWENGKNELSHQDTSMCECMLGESSEVSRVLFLPDYNSAAVVIRSLYQTHGQIWTLVVPKDEEVHDLFTPEEAEFLLERGAVRLSWAGHAPDQQRVVLTAIGAYQLDEVLKASQRLRERSIPHSVVYMLEPGRFRSPRNRAESEHTVPESVREELFPPSVEGRIFVVHTRPEPMLGILHPLDTGIRHTRALGFIGNGGTLRFSGMLFVNRCTWAHTLLQVAEVLGLPRSVLLTQDELSAIDGKASPEGVII